MSIETKQVILEFDDAIDKLYVRHDGGQDTRKGVIVAADYPDIAEISDINAAALLVSLDIFRGVPIGEDEFIFGADRHLAESAFCRLLARTCGTPRKEVQKIARSEGGLTYGTALKMVNEKLGSVTLEAGCPSEKPMDRAMAVELLAAALKASKGDGEIPYLFYVPENTAVSSLELPKNTVIAAPDGKLVTLTVDGVFQPLVGGYRYEGELVLTLTDRYELYRYDTEPSVPGMPPDVPVDVPPEPAWWNYFEEPYRAALFIENGKKIPERSVDAAYRIQPDGSILLESSDAPSNAFGVNNFNGIIVGGKNERYEINDLTVRFNGNGMDDFQGMGAGLLICGENTETIVNRADICNYGTVRSSMVVGGSAKVLVADSRLSTHEGFFEEGWIGGMGAEKMRQAPIWGGFEGNCRSTNLLDKAEANYINSQILAEKWGVLSTDNNKGCHSTAINSLVAITGGLNEKIDTSSEAAARESVAKIPFSEIYGELQRDMGDHPYASGMHPGGYGTYSIGNTTVKFAGSTVITADYANTCVNAAAKVIYCDSSKKNLEGVFGADTREIVPQKTVVYCDKAGVMMQRGNGNGGVTIQDGTVFHCGCNVFSVKSNGSFKIRVDDSTLISESGVILQLMDDDDIGRGDIVDPPSPTVEDRENAHQLIQDDLLNVYQAVPGRDVFAHFSNMTLNGDCYNASGYKGAIGRQELLDAKAGEKAPGNPFAAKPMDCARQLEMLLENVQYSGAISTAEGHHIDRDTGHWLSPVPHSKWYCLAMLENIPKPVYQAGLILKLTAGSRWNVTKTSYLSSLTVDETSVVCGKVYVNGVPVIPAAGVTYTGAITVEPGSMI